MLSASHWSKVRGTVRVRLLVLILLWRACALSCSPLSAKSLDPQHLQHFTASPPKSTLDMKKCSQKASRERQRFIQAASLKVRYTDTLDLPRHHVNARESHMFPAGHPASQEGRAPLLLSPFARPSRLEQPHHAQIDIPRHGSSCTAAVQADSRELLKI